MTSQEQNISYKDFKLPASIASKVDVARLVSDSESVDGSLTSIDIHDKVQINHHIDASMPDSLREFLDVNQLSFEDSSQRRLIIEQLRGLKDNVPIIHMTFAAEVDQESLERISAWVRETISPQAVIAVGMQPSLISGVYVRTANKVFDQTVRAKLKEGRHYLIEELEALSAK